MGAVLSVEERLEGLRLLSWDDLEEVLVGLPARDNAELLEAALPQEARTWIRMLPPDDVADVTPEGLVEGRRVVRFDRADLFVGVGVTADRALTEDHERARQDVRALDRDADRQADVGGA